jgi:raffinose/stachyose/melibiose transport system substrate-binding protein
MYLMGSWAVPMTASDDPETRENLNFFKFPEVEGGAGSRDDLIGTPGENFFSITKESENKEVAVEFLRYMTDEKARKDFQDLGYVPPFNDTAEKLEEPMQKKIFQAVEEASHMQLWYDQYLPSEIAEVHLNTLQGVFGGDLTPEEKTERMAEAISNYYDEEE